MNILNTVKSFFGSTVEGATERQYYSYNGEISLETKDEDLVKAKKQWLDTYRQYYSSIQERQKNNLEFWKGKAYNPNSRNAEIPAIDNVIFEAIETITPMATRQRPDVIVEADGTTSGENFAKIIRKMMTKHAQRYHLEIRLKRASKYWFFYLLGVVQLGWDSTKDDITYEALRPDTLILDPNGYMDDGLEFTGTYVGKILFKTAGALKEKFPKKKKEIDLKSGKNDGKIIEYHEWWTNEMFFYTMDEVVLSKGQNPHWNYPIEGMPFKRNHFNHPKMPFCFLSIFNLGDQPHDNTSLIEQNLAKQEMISKRIRQIDKNCDEANGGHLFGSSSGLTTAQVKTVVNSLRRGDAALLPGNPRDAYIRTQGQALQPDVFSNLVDMRNQIMNSFGVRGTTAQGIVNEETVGGKVMIREQDASRIGGGIAKFIEIFSEHIYNQLLQMIFVYYEDNHVQRLVGVEDNQAYKTLLKETVAIDLTINVKDGSMIPKDPVSKMNQSMGLAQMGLIDPETLFEALEMPDPHGNLEKLFMWQTAPDMLVGAKAGQVRQAQTEQQLADAATAMTVGEQQKLVDTQFEKPMLEEGKAMSAAKA